MVYGDALTWQNPWTYAVIALFFIMPLRLFSLLIPLAIVAGFAWYFSPTQTLRREYEDRERIKAHVWGEAREQRSFRREMRKQAEREQKQERRIRQEQHNSVLYQEILSLKSERNNLSAEITNLYNVASSIKRSPDTIAEINSIHTKIAELKSEKIKLSQAIDEKYLRLKKKRSNR